MGLSRSWIFGEADKESDEFLIADLEVVTTRITSAVDDGSRLDGLAAAQPNRCRRQFLDIGIEPHSIAEDSADHLVEPVGGHRVVTAIHDPPQAREPQLVARPRMGHERLQPGPLVRCEIRIVEGPCVVTTEGRSALDDQQREIGGPQQGFDRRSDCWRDHHRRGRAPPSRRSHGHGLSKTGGRWRI